MEDVSLLPLTGCRARFLHALALATVLLTVIYHGPASAEAGVKAVTAVTDKAAAQSDMNVGFQELSIEQRQQLLARMSDSQVRELLLQQLNMGEPGNADAETDTASTLIMGLESRAAGWRSRLGEIIAAAPELPRVFGFAIDRLTEGRGRSFMFVIILGIAVIFAVGCAVEWLFRRLVAAARRQIFEAKPTGAAAKCGYLIVRIAMDVAGVAVFGLAAAGTFFIFYQGHEPVRVAVLTYLGGVMLLRLWSLLSRFILAPTAPALRMFSLGDAAAHSIHKYMMWVVGYLIFAYLTLAFLSLLGVEREVVDLLAIILSTVFALALGYAVWRARGPVARLIEGSDGDARAGDRAKNIFAQVWHLFAMAYVLLVWSLAVLGRVAGAEQVIVAGVGSLLLVVAVPVVNAGLRGWLTPAMEQEPPTDSGDAEAANVEDGSGVETEAAGGHALGGYRSAIYRTLRIIMIAAAAVLFANLWGVDVFALSERSFGARITRALLDIGITILLAYAAWTGIKVAIDQKLRSETGPEVGELGAEGGGAGASRLGTLLPLLRTFLLATLILLAVLIVLSSLGVDIGPLIAGAGVVGLAIGFGAQTLVRDIVSGVFFLMDDAFRMGEYVDVGNAKGTVEAISIRSMRLRHHRGAIHTIPYGEIGHLTNYSRDWVMLKLELKVPHGTDIEKVRKVIKKIGLALLEHPECGPNILQPLKSQGVVRIEESAMIVRLKVMTKPGEQFVVRREAFKRIQAAFKEQGIAFAHSRVIVEGPKEAAEDDEDRAASGGAAAASAVGSSGGVPSPG